MWLSSDGFGAQDGCGGTSRSRDIAVSLTMCCSLLVLERVRVSGNAAVDPSRDKTGDRGLQCKSSNTCFQEEHGLSWNF